MTQNLPPGRYSFIYLEKYTSDQLHAIFLPSLKSDTDQSFEMTDWMSFRKNVQYWPGIDDQIITGCGS